MQCSLTAHLMLLSAYSYVQYFAFFATIKNPFLTSFIHVSHKFGLHQVHDQVSAQSFKVLISAFLSAY
jgi:hypothetical protein